MKKESSNCCWDIFFKTGNGKLNFKKQNKNFIKLLLEYFFESGNGKLNFNKQNKNFVKLLLVYFFQNRKRKFT